MLAAINNQNPQMRLIRRAAEILKSGGIVIYPTDTVYGMGCDLLNKRGIERIYEIQRRNRKQPLSFICADLKDISRYAKVSDDAYKIMKRLLPGPYTFILEASRFVPKIILPKRQTTGIRIPDNRICQALVAELGSPVIAGVRTGQRLPATPGDRRALRQTGGHDHRRRHHRCGAVQRDQPPRGRGRGHQSRKRRCIRLFIDAF